MPIGSPNRADIFLFVELPIILLVIACIGAGIWWALS